MIKLCEKCGGVGSVEEFYGHLYDNRWVTCGMCLGSGRQKVFEFKMSLPFNTDIELINKAIDEINYIINKEENYARKKE